jgi:hypothetical protein
MVDSSMVDSSMVDVDPSRVSSDTADRPSTRVDGYDVIAGAHDLEQLGRLLHRLGMRRDGDTWLPAHGRFTVFIGGVLDARGVERPCAGLVRDLVDAGSALMTLGREEFAAIDRMVNRSRPFFVARPDDRDRGPDSTPGRRSVSPSHRSPGRATAGPELVTWLMTVPMWLDLPGLRVVHSAWDDSAIARLKQAFGGNCVSDAGAVRRAASNPRLRDAVRCVFGLTTLSDGRTTASCRSILVTAGSLGSEHPCTVGAVAYRHAGRHDPATDRVLRTR